MAFPSVVRTGPLAMAALSYWRSKLDAQLALNLGLLSDAVERIEHLGDLAEAGHPAIRSRCAAALPRLLAVLEHVSREHSR